MATRSASRWRLLVQLLCLLGLVPALAAERSGDAVARYALEDRGRIVGELEAELLMLIDASPDEDRFELYLTYDQLAGTWLQMEISRALLDAAATATSLPEETSVRTTLRDQSRYALWELDAARAALERSAPAPERREHFRINAAIRALFSDTRSIAERLLADQCDFLRC